MDEKIKTQIWKPNQPTDLKKTKVNARKSIGNLNMTND